MLSLLVLSSAFAGDLSLQWSPLRYHAETLLTLPGGYWVVGEGNVEARATQIDLSLDMSCQPEVKKKGWDLTCDVERAAFGGKALSPEKDQDKLNTALASYAAELEAATPQLTVREDGRLTTVDLDGVDQASKRDAFRAEVLRQLVRRALSPLDVQLPKGGVDPGKPWNLGGTPLAAELFPASAPVWVGEGSSAAPMSGGVSGGLRVPLSVSRREGAVVVIAGEGKGTISTYATDNGSYLSAIALQTETRFDSAAGQVAYSFVHVSAKDAGANASVTGVDGYAHTAWVGRINADGSVEGQEGPVASTGP